MNTNSEITRIGQDGLEAIVQLAIDAVPSEHSKRAYRHSIEEFLSWWEASGRPPLIKATVQRYRSHLQTFDYAPATINLKMAGIRKLAQEAADNGLIDDIHANGISRVKGVKHNGVRTGNWLSKDQAQELLNSPDITTLKGLRDRAVLAVMLGAGLRRSEVSNLSFEHIQQRAGRWVIVDILGKGNRVRTIPIAPWVKYAIDAWVNAAGITDGRIFRGLWRYGYTLNPNSEQISTQVVYNIVKEYAGEGVAAHDLRRTYAKLSNQGGAALGQIQLNLGHASLRTTEMYLGLELDLTDAPGDRLGLRLK